MVKVFASKKGDVVIDWLVVIAALLVTAILFIVAWQVMGKINTAFQDNPHMLNESKEQTSQFYTKMNGWMDFIFAFLLFGCWIASMIFAYFIDSHPVFFVLSLLMLVFVIIFGAVASNTFEAFTDTTAFSTAENAFPIMLFIMNHLVETVVVIIFSVAIVLYGKYSRG